MQSTAVTNAGRTASARLRSLPGFNGKSLFDSLFPSATIWHRLAAAIAMAGVTALLAQARFFLPDNPVPITFQVYGVLMTGGLLGFRWGLLSAVIYYVAGMAGIPVFQSGNGGWNYIAHGLTGGYLIGFILASGVTGFLSQRGWNRGSSLWAMLLASLLVYGPGLIWLAVFDLGWPAEGELFSAGMYPFIPGDLVKVMLAALTAALLWKAADRRAEDRQIRYANTER